MPIIIVKPSVTRNRNSQKKMNIEIYRNRTNRLYTEGMLFVNDCFLANTVEATEIMLPAGTYRVWLGRTDTGKRQIFFGERWRIGLCHSWIGSKRQRMIAIGQILFPGALYKGTGILGRIIDRLEYAFQEKQAEVSLTIYDCRQPPERTVYRHWRSMLGLLLILLCTSCGSLRHQPPVEVVKALSHDTVYVSGWQYDSVLVYQDRFIDRSQDTVYLQNNLVEYRYRLIRDTLRICRTDTIPVVRTVEVVKPERYVPWYVTLLSWLGIIWLVLLVAKLRIPIQK